MHAAGKFGEQTQIHGFRHCLVSRWVQVQVVSSVVGRGELSDVARIPHSGVKINDGIESTARADPLEYSNVSIGREEIEKRREELITIDSRAGVGLRGRHRCMSDRDHSSG